MQGLVLLLNRVHGFLSHTLPHVDYISLHAYYAANEPYQPWEGVDPRSEEYAAMKAKFAQRPVWSRQALRASLPAPICKLFG